MLVLTRREGEEIVIGDPAKPIGTVKVVSIRGDRVRVLCDFPRDVEVNRKEVADSKLRQRGLDQSAEIERLERDCRPGQRGYQPRSTKPVDPSSPTPPVLKSAVHRAS